MPTLKTLPALDSPRVLLVGAEPWLISQVSLLFAAHEITATALSGTDFLNVDVAKVDPHSVYKIVWWVDFSNLETQRKVLEKLATLKQFSLVVLGRLPELFLLEQEAVPPALIDQQRFFKALSSALSEAQFFFSRDMLATDVPEGPLAFSLRGHQQQALLDPETAWFPSSQASFFEVLAPYLVRPHTSQRVIVGGKRSMSTPLLKKFADLCARYYGTKYTIVPAVAARKSPQVLGFVETALPIISEAFLDELARKWHQWKDLLSKTSFPVFKSTNRVVVDPIEDKAPLAVPPQSISQEAGELARKKKLEKDLINQEEIHSEFQQEEKIEGELARIFHDNRNEKKEKRIDDKVKIVKKIAKKSRKNTALFYGGMVAMAVGGLVLILWGVFFTTTLLARREIAEFLTNNSPGENQEYSPGTWSSLLQLQVNAYQAILSEDWLGEGGDLVKFEKAMLNLQQQKNDLNSLVEGYFLSLLGREAAPANFAEELTEKLSATHQFIAEALLTAMPLVQGNSKLENEWTKVLETEQQRLAILSQFPEEIANIFGAGGKRTYAVLLQNNLELRPTGGFIQAIAFLVFDQGLLIDSRVVSVYDIDKSLPGTVLAPAEIKKYLGEENWYLRDSNWNPDFPLVAQRAAWFIKEATGFQVDGVIALNYSVLQKILAAAGPMELTAFDELLTKDNLLERVEFHSDDELASASPDKKDYALEVFIQILNDIKESPAEEAPQILNALSEALETKQLLVSFTDPDQEEAMAKLEWNGEIINPVCPTRFSQSICLVDQIFQVETNVSLNRVNAYIRREIQHRVDLSGEKATHTRTITMENTARSQGWPLGTYKAYLRFILDGEAQPTTVKVNGKKLAGDSLTIYGEGGRKVVGVLIEVPPQSQTTLEFSYLTEDVPSGPFSFLLFDQKQPGITETPIAITIHNTKQQAVLIAPTAEIYGSSLEFSLLQKDHLFIGASFQ